MANRRLAGIGPNDWRPSSSVYSDDAATTSLLRQLSEMRRVQELRTIQALLNENQALREEIAVHYRRQIRTTATLSKIVKVVARVEKSLKEFDSKSAAATKGWLAYWGIYAEVGKFGTVQPQWI